ncbi:MAG: DUF58 domain-containing protein [Thermodesulfobacteriota bacterium]
MKRLGYLLLKYSSSLRHWLRLHISLAGTVYFFLLVGSAVLGLDTNQTTVYQLFSLLVAIGLIGFLFCLFFRVDIGVQRQLPRFVTAGERFNYRLVATNHHKKGLSGLVVLDEPLFEYPTFIEFSKGLTTPADEKTKGVMGRLVEKSRWSRLIDKRLMGRANSYPLDDLAANRSEEITLQLTPLRRGILRFSKVTFGRPDPFGLFRTLAPVSCEGSLVVLPRRYPLPPIDLSGRRKYQPAGVALASSVGDSQEFMSIRDYRPGDPPRTIHWRSWAKSGRPMVKEFQDEYFSRHGLILDTCGKGDGDRCFEEAVSVAASLACTVVTRDSLLDLLFVDRRAYCFTSGRSVGHQEKLLEILASLQASSSRNFDELSSLVSGRINLLSSCIAIFLDWDRPRQELVNTLAVQKIPVLSLVISEKEVPGEAGGAGTNNRLHWLHPGKIGEGLAAL